MKSNGYAPRHSCGSGNLIILTLLFCMSLMTGCAGMDIGIFPEDVGEYDVNYVREDDIYKLKFIKEYPEVSDASLTGMAATYDRRDFEVLACTEEGLICTDVQCECDPEWRECDSDINMSRKRLIVTCDVTEWIREDTRFQLVFNVRLEIEGRKYILSQVLSTSIMNLEAYVERMEEEGEEDQDQEEDGDRDDDGVADTTDNCPDAGNGDQADTDSDGVGDACDNCVEYANRSQDPGDEDLCRDTDGDGVADFDEKCEGLFDPSNISQQCLSFNAIGGTPVRGKSRGGGCSLMPASSGNLISFALLVISIAFIRTRRRHTSQGR